MRSHYQRLRRKMAVTLLPETQDYVQRVIAASGTISNAAMQATDQFVRALLDNSLWQKAIEIGVFAGDNLNAALVKLKYRPGGSSSLTNNGFVAGDYIETGTNGGLLGNGTSKYLNTQTSPANLGPTGHASFYLRESFSSGEWRSMIATQDALDIFGLRRGVLATQNTGLWGKNAAASESAAPVAGFYIANRQTSSLVQLFRSGQLIGTETSAVTVNCHAQSFLLFAHNNNGSAAEYLNRRGCFYSLGSPLTNTEAALLSSFVQTLETALNRQV